MNYLLPLKNRRSYISSLLDFSITLLIITVAGINCYAYFSPSPLIKSTFTDSSEYKSLACNFAPDLWLKGDIGVTTANNLAVNIWEDQSGQFNNATPSANNQRPRLIPNSINFNPALDFDGSNDHLQGSAGGSNTTLFIVAQADLSIANTTRGQTIFTTSVTNPNVDAYFFAIGSITAAFPNEILTHGFGSFLEYRKVFLGNTTLPSTVHLYNINHDASISDASIHFDGSQIDNNTANTFINPENNRPYRVGGNLYVYGGTYFDGQIAEVLSFPTILSQNDREIMQSYLAIKYGITLAHAYQSSDEIVLWNEADYPNTVAAIGRDDCFSLNQKQSQSVEEEAIITMGLGTIASDNASNPNTFSQDQSFLFWGNDGDDDGQIEEINTEVPAGITTRLDREWKIRNINGIGAVEIQFDLTNISHSAVNETDLFLMIDNDGNGNFNDGVIQQIPATSFNSGIVSFSSISLPDNVVISLATSSIPNNAPQLTCPPIVTEVCPDGQLYDFATSLNVVDLENDNLSALITLDGITDNSDELIVDLTGFPNATQNFNYPTLEISGTISPGQIQNILRTVQFRTNSTLAGIRQIRLIVNDAIASSNEIIKEIQSDENLSICCSANAPLISK